MLFLYYFQSKQSIFENGFPSFTLLVLSGLFSQRGRQLDGCSTCLRHVDIIVFTKFPAIFRFSPFNAAWPHTSAWLIGRAGRRWQNVAADMAGKSS
jgi:hypothetical protein